MKDSVISIDFSQIELMVLATHLEERRQKWQAIRQSPGFMRYCRLRKSRARAIVEAIATRKAQGSGNLTIRFLTARKDHNPEQNEDVHLLAFYYRGTTIATWYPETGEYHNVDCGEYESAPSTRNQRKLIREAIQEFNEAVFGCL